MGRGKSVFFFFVFCQPVHPPLLTVLPRRPFPLFSHLSPLPPLPCGLTRMAASLHHHPKSFPIPTPRFSFILGKKGGTHNM
ncbi:hypothetical protein BKA57DRAFT_154457 [Linnemannia elongata]|nr:hypothetical protein BKA57DRAFT_154457 [Linnemannia elongata]